MASLTLRSNTTGGLSSTQIDNNFTTLNADGLTKVSTATKWTASTSVIAGQVLYVLESDVTAGTDTSAGSFIVGKTYVIVTPGTTVFTSIGATSNTAGTIFTATGVGSGSGTAKLVVRFYEVTASGTTSSTGPNHTSGTITNGTADLLFVNDPPISLVNKKINNTYINYDLTNYNLGIGYKDYAGNFPLSNNSTGGYNTALGFASNAYNTSGGWNTSVGFGTMDSNQNGSWNVSIGHQALSGQTFGNDNIAIGGWTYPNFGNAEKNIAIGSSAMEQIKYGNRNIAIGYTAFTTSGSYGNGDYNVFIGDQAGAGATGRISKVVAIGSNAGLNLSGDIYGSDTGVCETVAIGYNSLANNTFGGQNTAVGYLTGSNNTSGSQNTFLGDQAGLSNISGSYNTFLGSFAGASMSSASYGNTVVGPHQGLYDPDGNNISSVSNQVIIANGNLKSIFYGNSTKTVIANDTLQLGFSYGGSDITMNATGRVAIVQGAGGIGTVSNTAGGTTVTGVGTLFTRTFQVGDTITIGGQTVAISAIASDTSMTTAAITAANTNVTYTLVGGTRHTFNGSGYVSLGNNPVSATGIQFGGAVSGNTVKVVGTATGTIFLTTDVTTGIVNIFNSLTTGTVNLAIGGASTINLGGTASAVNIGTTTGNSTLTIRGNSTSGTATLQTNTGVTTAAVFNTFATTGNLFGAATAITIGATTGTTTVRNSLVVSGDLTINGTTTTVNTNTLTVDDKNIEIGSVPSATISATGTVGSITGTGPWTATITGMTTTAGLIIGSAIAATAGTGTLYGGSPTSVVVASIVSSTSITYTVTGGTIPTAGTVTAITTTGATDLTAQGGGITLKGASDKSISWDSVTAAWVSSESINLASGKVFKIAGNTILSATTLDAVTVDGGTY